MAPTSPHLSLDQDDKQVLTSHTAWLNDKIVNACQKLLKTEHPHVDGLQSTLLGENLGFSVEPNEFVTMGITTGCVYPLWAARRTRPM